MSQTVDTVPNWIERAIMLVAYLTTILVMGLDTIRCMITGDQPPWGPEIAMGASFRSLGSQWPPASRTGTHLSFTTFRERMPLRVRQGFEAFDCLL